MRDLLLPSLGRQVSQKVQTMSYASVAAGPQKPARDDHTHSQNSQPNGHLKAQEQSQRQRSPSTRRAAHRPNTRKSGSGDEEEDVYVLTLLTDKTHHTALTNLRTQYFPPHLNKLGAHITLFHALPGSHLEEVTSTLEDVVVKGPQREPWPIETADAFLLGGKSKPKGVGIGVSTASDKRVMELRDLLQDRWGTFLSEQDSRPGRGKAHYTIMNKVDEPETVWKCLKEVKEGWCKDGEGRKGIVDGVRLWRYDRGYWKDGTDFRYRDPRSHRGEAQD